MSRFNMESYEVACQSFSWERPEKYNFVCNVIDRWADAAPSKLALFWVDDHGAEAKFTFAELACTSRRLCNVLSDAGVCRGDTVILLLARQPAWWECMTACLRMGAVASPGTAQLSERDLEYRINAAKAVCVITDSANASKVERIADSCPSLKARLLLDGVRDSWISYHEAVRAASTEFDTADTSSDEDALCYFTSGTTGYPKMCIHSHSYPIGHVATGKYWLDLGPDDLHWNISDTGWAKAAWSSYFGPWSCGAAIFVHHTVGFTPKKALELLQRYPITTLCGAPTVYRMLVQEDLTQFSFSSLRHCVGAGEPLNPEVIQIWKKATSIVIRDGYGQTETALLCASFPCLEPRFGSMGKPAPGVDLHVIDDHGQVLLVGQEGDIAIRVAQGRPQGLFKEYRNNPEKTEAAIRGAWYVTGDRGFVDDEGYFWFIGRADDVILSAGYRIGPFEVESALIEHPAVAECAVVASPDGIRGEVVKAFVVLAPGHNPSDNLKKALQEFVKSITAPYKYPRKLEFVESLPKTVSGKIRRVELRERERVQSK